MLKKVLIDTQDIGYTESFARQQWMTNEILRLMDDRRREKVRGGYHYGELNRRVRTECRKAKDCWLTERCTKIEALQDRHDLSIKKSRNLPTRNVNSSRVF